MKSRNYILLLLLLLLPTICSCSNRKIEVGNIENRSQLDDILSELSPDSVRIDSLANRTLMINLTGNFTIFEVPARHVSFKLINEELENMDVYGFPKGALSMLNNIESKHGLATYEDSEFSWELNNRTISLQAQNRRMFQRVQPLHLHDSLGGTFTVEYHGFEQNKITDIAKEYKPNADFKRYKLFTAFYSSIRKYKIWLNDFLITDESMSLNRMIPTKGKQTITIEFLPSEDLPRVKDHMINMEGASMSINLAEYSSKGQRKIKLPISSDMLVAGQKNVLTFDLPNITYTLDYINGKDLRNESGLKEKIYAHYKSLKDAYEAGDENKLMAIIYPLEKQNTIAFNRSEKDLQAIWKFEKELLADNEGFDLMDINDLKVEFAYNGKVARLVPSVEKEDGCALKAYTVDQEVFFLDHYIYIDNTNKLNFVVE